MSHAAPALHLHRLHGRHVAVKFGDCFNSKPKVLRLRNEVAAYKAMEQLQGRFLPRLEEYGYTVSKGSGVCQLVLVATGRAQSSMLPGHPGVDFSVGISLGRMHMLAMFRCSWCC